MTLPFSYSSTSTIDIETKINNDLVKLQGWSEYWLTTFNPTKTKLVFISNIENGSDINLRFNNSRLELSTVHVHLGVTFSNDTKWANPIDGIYKSCSNKVVVLRNMF